MLGQDEATFGDTCNCRGQAATWKLPSATGTQKEIASDTWSASICRVLVSSTSTRPANQKGFSFPRRYNSIVKAPRSHKLCTLPSLHHDRSVISDPTHTTLSPEDTYFPELPADDHSQDGTKRHACSETGVTSHSPRKRPSAVKQWTQ